MIFEIKNSLILVNHQKTEFAYKWMQHKSNRAKQVRHSHFIQVAYKFSLLILKI